MAIAAISIVTRGAVGWNPLLASMATASLLFVVLLILALRGWLGGGDVKLAAALALGLSPAATWDFLILTVLAGGLLGLSYLAGPSLALRIYPFGSTQPFNRILAIEAWRLRRGGPFPYGIAIAAGAICVMLAGP